MKGQPLRPQVSYLVGSIALASLGPTFAQRIWQVTPSLLTTEAAWGLMVARGLATLLVSACLYGLFAVPGLKTHLQGRHGPWIYYGFAFFCSLVAAGLLYLAWGLLGLSSLGAQTALVDGAENIAINMNMAWRSIRYSFAQAALVEGKQRLNEALGRLESVRLMNRQGHSQRTSEALATLEDRIAPVLDALIAEVDDLAKHPVENLNPRLESLLAQLDQLREADVRLLSHQLHPSIIDVGMMPALHSLVAHYRADFKISLELPAVEPADPPPLVRLTFFRCAEEALDNIKHHAGASQATLRWQALEEEWLLTIRDDGIGFDPNHVSPGLGLNRVAGRVSMTGGVWSLASAPGQGTVLEIRIPR